MTQESLQAEVLAALSASLTSSNTKEIQDVTNILYNLSWRNGTLSVM